MIHCTTCQTTKLWMIDHEILTMRWYGPKEEWPQFDSELYGEFECENGHKSRFVLRVSEPEENK